MQKGEVSLGTSSFFFSNMKFLSYVSDKYTCLFDWAIVYL